MKQLWRKLSLKLDAMTLRERAMVFAASAAGLYFVLSFLSLDPLYRQQKVLLASINQQRNLLAGVDTEITQRVEAYSLDPDVANRARLKKLQQDADQLGTTLGSMQKGLVAPEKIVPLLENILNRNGKLRLVSLKTLATSGMTDGAFDQPEAVKDVNPSDPRQISESAKLQATALVPASAAAKPAASAGALARPGLLLYRHGVEVVVQGGYLDMVNYMAALETMPIQLFWGKARLNVEQYPKTTLTLTLYTLSLDKKWMKL